MVMSVAGETRGDGRSRIRRAVLALGPFFVLGSVLVGLFLTSPFGNVEELAAADTLSLLWMLTIVGLFAGTIPVLIGMLWYPFLRSLEARWIHAVLALSIGVLTFAGYEMLGGIVDNAAATPVRGTAAAVVGVAGAFWALSRVSEWRYRKIREDGAGEAMQVAYLIAIGLGLHSIGEGLAIGTAFVQGEGRLVTLLVIAFMLDNVTEGPTIVAAIASDQERPPIYQFVALGAIAGGPLVLGGWIGSFALSPSVAALFFAIGLGAIAQVVWEVTRFIGVRSGNSMRAAITRLNAATFVLGVAIMIVVDEIVIDMLLL